MVEELYNATKSSMPGLELMSQEERSNIFYHCIHKGPAVYFQLIIEPDWILIFVPQVQPLYDAIQHR
jgi:hypothetical protein